MPKWSPEQRAKYQKTLKAKKTAVDGARKADAEDAHTTGSVLTVLRHGAADVLLAMQRGEVTLRNLQRRDALLLLAYVETRGRV